MPESRGLLHPKYRPDIDGLRGVAVLAVVGYHAFPTWVTGGFVGVDVFFVISGFLISTIIIENLERGSFGFVEFYARRVKRIFPTLILVLCASLAFGWFVLFIDEYSQLGKHVSAGAGFVSNLVRWGEVGYFDKSAELKPLLHLWSLGIEEQFYIFWPILLVLVRKRDLNFLLVTLVIAVVSLSLCIYLTVVDPVAGFYSPFSRIWELMAGGILAYLFLHKPQFLVTSNVVTSLIAAFGLLLVVAGVLFLTEQVTFPGFWALLPVAGAFLVIFARSDNWISRYLLGNRVMVGFGLISYPLYLWHWPILSYVAILKSGGTRGGRVALVLLSIALAWITYEFVEKRFRKAYSQTEVLSMLIMMTILIVVGIVVWNRVLLPRHDSTVHMKIYEALGDWNYPGDLTPVMVGGNTFYTKKAGAEKTLFLGDSHIEQYGPRIYYTLNGHPDYNTAVFATGGGCIPVPWVREDHPIHRLCPDLLAIALDYAARQDVEKVVIGGAWNYYFIDQVNGVGGYRYYYEENNDTRHAFSGGGGEQFTIQALEKLMREFVERGKKVYLLLDNPSGTEYSPLRSIEGSRIAGLEQRYPMNEYEPYRTAQKTLREKLSKLAASAGASVIDPVPSLCRGSECRATTGDGRPIYKDATHLRPFFVEKNANFMDVALY